MVKQQQAPTLVGFRNYFEQLEAHLGALLVPIQHGATGPRQIVTTEALHADLARKAAVAIYRENQCRGYGVARSPLPNSGRPGPFTLQGRGF